MLGYSLIVLTPHLTRRPKTYNIHRVGNDIVRYSMLLLCYKYDLLFVALAIFVGCNFITSKEPLALNITFLYMNIIFLALNIKIN
jgi:predicted nucleic acid-binding protein